MLGHLGRLHVDLELAGDQLSKGRGERFVLALGQLPCQVIDFGEDVGRCETTAEISKHPEHQLQILQRVLDRSLKRFDSKSIIRTNGYQYHQVRIDQNAFGSVSLKQPCQIARH